MGDGRTLEVKVKPIDFSGIRDLLKSGKIDAYEYILLKKELKKEWKEKRYRICLSCEEKKLRSEFNGQAKYCNNCKIKKKEEGKLKRKKSTKKYLITVKGKVYKQNKNARYKARKCNSDGTVGTESLYQLLLSQSLMCNYCQINLEENEMHLDHIKPLSKGGEHSIGNLQFLCAKCNIKKSNIYPFNPQHHGLKSMSSI